MSYTDVDFKSKKALKEAVVLYLMAPEANRPVTIYNPGMGVAPDNGTASLEGPHYPKPHTWYARVLVKDGNVIKVVS